MGRGRLKGKGKDSFCVEGKGARKDFRRWCFKNVLVLRCSVHK